MLSKAAEHRLYRAIMVRARNFDGGPVNVETMILLKDRVCDSLKERLLERILAFHS